MWYLLAVAEFICDHELPAEEKRNSNETAIINDDDDDDAELKKALAMSLATTNGDPINPSELLHLMLPVVLANASAALGAPKLFWWCFDRHMH